MFLDRLAPGVAGAPPSAPMRIRIAHATTYRYAAPPRIVTQTLRLTPRNHDGQFVANWRLGLSADCELFAHDDAFGNLSHTFTAEGPFDELTVALEGEIETQDTNGILTGTLERFPPSLFLRETDLTRPDEAIIAFGEAARGPGNALAMLHRLLDRIYNEMKFDTDPTHPSTTAIEAFALKRGVCQDLTHIFIACARHLEIPARYIGGYFCRSDGVTAQEAGHAWAEAYVDNDIGWVAFDPANGICATDAHVRIAVGLDYLGAAPVRGTRIGGGGESMEVEVHVTRAHHAQAQAQSQT